MTQSRDDFLTDRVHDVSCSKCGQTLDVSKLPPFSKFKCGMCSEVHQVPARLGAFLLTEPLGEGGMGAVYRGLDPSLNRPVAVKVMLRAVGEDREAFQQFQREAQAAAALNHPNIVQIYSFGEEKQRPYIVMELLAGGRLDQMIASGKPLDQARLVQIAIGVAEGLSAAYAIGLMHGDIKPENILLDANGTPKVVDFGLARFKDREADREGVWGTPYYIAPEKVRRQRVDARSDIYSLGATLFHALAGQPPFDGDTPVEVVKARLTNPAPDVRTLRADLHPRLAAVIARMLEGEPAKRYPTYASLLADLHEVENALPGAAPARRATAGKRRSGRMVITKSAPQSGVYRRPGLPQEAPRRQRRKGRGALWFWIIFLLLHAGGGGYGGYRTLAWQKEQARAEADRAALAAARRAATDLHAALAAEATGVLARAEAAYFADTAVTGALAEARAVLAALGADAELVTLPEIPADAEAATAAVQAAELALGSVTNAADLYRQAAAAHAAAQGAAASAAARAAVTELERLQAELDPLWRRAARELDAVDAAVAQAREWSVRAEELKQAAALRRTERDAQQAEAERRRQEAERKRQEEEAQRERVAAELARVDDAWESVAMPRVKVNDFAGAARAFEQAVSGLESEDARQAAARQLERCRILVDLRAYLVTAIHENPYRWGWIAGASQVDVMDATADEIVIRTGRVPWSDVSALQMLRFLSRYVPVIPGPDMMRSRLAELNLAAAVYCHVNGGEKPAAEYAGRAIRLNDDLAADVARLMPDLDLEP